MLEDLDIIELIGKRYSCRTYDGEQIAAEIQQQIRTFLDCEAPTPFGARASRLVLMAATGDDQTAVRRLGTYGVIKGASAYIAGAVLDVETTGVLEDFGYLMERAVLYATGLGLGTVWLGGTFTKSRFERRLSLRSGESLPAVLALGNAAANVRAADAVIRRGAQADKRLAWEHLVYEVPGEGRGLFETSLSRESSGPYETALDMVRIGPSASNKQPWRIVRDTESWHFYMHRTRGYRPGSAFLGVADMQRIDMGIALCHFELVALQLGLAGHWVSEDPGLPLPGSLTSHVATWVPG